MRMISVRLPFGSRSTLPLCGKSVDGYPSVRGDGLFEGVEAVSGRLCITSNVVPLMHRKYDSVRLLTDAAVA